MILAASSAFASRSSACGRFRSAKTFPELGVNSRLGIFPLLTSRPVCAQVEAAAGSGPVPVAGSRFRRLPSFGRHEDVNRFPELCYEHRAIRPARIVCAHLPDRFRKAVQHLRALMFLTDLRLIKCETEPVSNRGREARQPN